MSANELPKMVEPGLTAEPSTGRRRLRLLYVGDDTLARECLGRPGGSIEVVAASRGPDGGFEPLTPGVQSPPSSPCDILFIEHACPGVETLAILKEVAARNLHVPVVIVADWDEALAVRALEAGASDYVLKSRASFRAVYFRLHRLIGHSALIAEQAKLRAAHAATIEHDRAVRDDNARRLIEAVTARHSAESQLGQAVAALKQGRQDRLADAVAAARELAQRESTFAARVADATATAERLQQQLAERDASLRAREERAAAEERARSLEFARRHAEIEAALNNEAALRRTVEMQLAHAETLRQAADDQRRADAATSADTIAHLRAEFTASIAQLTRARDTFARRLDEALEAVEQAHADRAAAAAAAAQHLAHREHALLAEIGSAAEIQKQLEQRLTDAETALRCAEQRAAAEQHAARQLAAERQAEFEAEHDRLTASREALKQQLAEATLAVEATEQRYASAEAEAEARFAAAQVRYDALLAEAAQQTATERAAADAEAARHRDESAAALAREASQRQALESALAEAEAARARAAQQHASEMARAAEHEAVLQSDLVREATNRHALEIALADAEAARDGAVRQHAADVSEAAARLADQQRQTNAWLTDAAALADALDAKLASSVAALERAEQRTAFERQTASEEASRREAEFEARLADEIARREAEVALRETREAQLREVETALECARQRHVSELGEAAARLADQQRQTDAWLTDAAALADALDEKLQAAAAAIERSEQQSALERQSATAEASRRQEEFEARLAERDAALEEQQARAVTEAQAFERALIEADEARRLAEEHHASQMQAAAAEIAAARQQEAEVRAELAAARDHRVILEQRAAEDRVEWDRVRGEAEQRLQLLQIDGDRLRQSLADAAERIQQQEDAHERERAHFNQAWADLEADLARQRAETTALQHTLAETRTMGEETVARLSNERAVERAALEALLAERDTQLREHAARHQQSEAAAAAALAESEDRVRRAAETHRADQHAIAQLEQTLSAVRQELDAMTRERNALSVRAERVPALQRQIDGIQVAQRRQFNEMPVSMCRCGRDGAMTQVNRALARLLGYATPEDVQTLDAGHAIFDSGDELQWLFDLCQTSRTSQSIETTWKKRDGSLILVRVMAMPVASDLIDLVAEDITRIRVLEEKLRNSQRMEAVARYGSEVAVTCHSLLSHVKQEGQRWLATVESETARYQGELLFHDVTRAAVFLEQFAAYGHEQKNTPELVEVNTLLRDLEPVLKRVAGDNIDFVVKPPRTPLNVDVEARRVERMLINVAAYSRERMPFGGRLAIDVASVVLNREFVAKYPNVRPGAHVLLTVSEVPGVARPDFSDTVRTPAAAAHGTPPSNPGVDLGTLQALVSDCGGHLWMRAERSGNMVLKIHVPRRILDRSEPAMRPVRPRWIHRAFGARH